MVPGPSNGDNLGRYLAMGQVGMEMAGPIAIGVLLDYWLGWRPWCTVAGACVGLVMGLVLLVRMANKDNKRGPADNKPESP
jgi:F0F1-type ATP synthase assembly protein I